MCRPRRTASLSRRRRGARCAHPDETVADKAACAPPTLLLADDAGLESTGRRAARCFLVGLCRSRARPARPCHARDQSDRVLRSLWRSVRVRTSCLSLSFLAGAAPLGFCTSCSPLAQLDRPRLGTRPRPAAPASGHPRLAIAPRTLIAAARRSRRLQRHAAFREQHISVTSSWTGVACSTVSPFAVTWRWTTNNLQWRASACRARATLRHVEILVAEPHEPGPCRHRVHRWAPPACR